MFLLLLLVLLFSRNVLSALPAHYNERARRNNSDQPDIQKLFYSETEEFVFLALFFLAFVSLPRKCENVSSSLTLRCTNFRKPKAKRHDSNLDAVRIKSSRWLRVPEYWGTELWLWLEFFLQAYGTAVRV